MVPKKISNLILAGRCISSDRLSNAAIRVKAICMAMGQASGTAAYIAISEDKPVKNIDINQLKRLLDKSGAIVPKYNFLT
jgi:hypothetical protein